MPKPARSDPLDSLAEAAGMSNGEAFWNGLVEEAGDAGDPIATFAAVGDALSEARARAEADGEAIPLREIRREAFMRLNIRQALKEHEGPVVAVVGAWHVAALARKVALSEDRAIIRDLPRAKVEATWVPWTDSRLAAASGYGAGVVSPGWHLWAQHSGGGISDASAFAAHWQARTAALMRSEGHGRPQLRPSRRRGSHSRLPPCAISPCRASPRCAKRQWPRSVMATT